MSDRLVRFRGFEFIWMSDGALTTRDVAAAGDISFAHVHSDGLIHCFDDIIGGCDELEIVEEVIPAISVGPGVLGWIREWTRARWEEVWSDRIYIAARDVTPQLGPQPSDNGS